MTVVTCDLNSIPEPFSLLICNCIALLIVATIAACVKLIRIACKYASPSSCCVQYLAYLELAEGKLSIHYRYDKKQRYAKETPRVKKG